MNNERFYFLFYFSRHKLEFSRTSAQAQLSMNHGQANMGQKKF